MNQAIPRTTFRNIWLLTIALMLVIAFTLYRQAVNTQDDMASQQMQLAALRAELDNASRRSLALDKLDGLTINEKTATRLDILRHLGLEQTEYDFQVNTRQARQVGDSSLYLRNVRLEGDMPYAQALDLLDRLRATNKIVLNKMTLRASPKTGDNVHMILEGTIYGLDKNV